MSTEKNILPADQLSPKAIILAIFSVKNVFKKEWKLILAFTLSGLTFGGWYAYTKFAPAMYGAALVFNVEGSASNMGGLADLAQAFGLGGASSNNIFSGENFLQLLRSRTIYEKALTSEVTVKGKKQLFLNYFLDVSKVQENEFEDDEKIQNFRFKHRTVETMDTLEIANLVTIREYLGAHTDIYQDNKKASYQTLFCETYNQQLSINWVNALLKSVTDFYIYTKTQKSQELYELLKQRTDSLKIELYGTEARLSRQVDANQYQIMQEGRLTETRLQRNTSQLSAMYLEAFRQLDNVKLSIVRESPIVTVIDKPRLPLQPRFVRIDRIVWGFTILGFILAFVYIFLRNAYREVMASEV